MQTVMYRAIERYEPPQPGPSLGDTSPFAAGPEHEAAFDGQARAAQAQLQEDLTRGVSPQEPEEYGDYLLQEWAAFVAQARTAQGQSQEDLARGASPPEQELATPAHAPDHTPSSPLAQLRARHQAYGRAPERSETHGHGY